GIDLAVPIGTPVYAAMDGTVLGKQPPGRTGRYVFLSHPGGRNTYYGHLSRPLVSPGQAVKQGQKIALSGNTGKSTGPHLHYETWSGGRPVNPAAYLSGASLPEGAEGAGGFFDPVAPFRALGNTLASKVDKLLPDGGMVADLSTNLVKNTIDEIAEWASSKMSVFSDGEGGGTVADADVQAAVQTVAGKDGWGSGAQWNALSKLIQKESSWNPNAANPRSTARGLFQKMTSIHGAIESTAAGQAKWGLKYIKQRYGSPAAALAFHNRHNHYADGGLVGSITRDSGGVVPPGSSVINNRTRDPEWMYTNKQQDTVQAALDVLKDGAGTNVNFYGPTYMRNEDQFAEHYEERARRQRKVGLVATL